MKVEEIVHNYGSKSSIKSKQQFSEYRCPTCGLILLAHPNFCGKCGTLLEWPDGVKKQFEDWQKEATDHA
ncbi:hypothetical protein EQM14_01550 [Caproiciproducens sp. NJN-50]|uniref:hypothetical protein n=1 Tax=Caproiciproducens sp. NJN-50 TaxID=2507162 RepID=UPI000FFE1431|nr:hypothetical protein [Caproiciproducens sp. NJN-50]QAT48569.1 hypothetical protein EQM14_01550 [Caproiciproducens sp. NJN-50]